MIKSKCQASLTHIYYTLQGIWSDPDPGRPIQSDFSARVERPSVSFY